MGIRSTLVLEDDEAGTSITITRRVDRVVDDNGNDLDVVTLADEMDDAIHARIPEGE